MSNVLPAETENQTYAKLWKEWESKVCVTIRRWSLQGIVGCTFDDFYSVAQSAMLHSIRNYNPDLAKFSTFFYTNLKNAIKTELGRSGLVRSRYKVRIVNKKTSETIVLSKIFNTEEGARIVSEQIRGRRRANVIIEKENRHKRIPPTDIRSFASSSLIDHDEGEESAIPEKRLGVLDRRKIVRADLMRAVGRRIVDRKVRKLLLRIYVGDTTREAARHIKWSQKRVDMKLRAIRRTAIRIIKDLKA